VAYSFDARRQLVVLDRLDQAVSPSGVLCARHATAMVVPRGWWLDDRRIPVPTLFAPGAVNLPTVVETTPAATAVRTVRAPKVIPAGLPFETLDPADPTQAAVVDVAPANDVTVDSVEADSGETAHVETAAPARRPAWMPSADSDQDEFGDVEVPSSPLLSRAFSGGNRRR
jgi:hypothetical protein